MIIRIAHSDERNRGDPGAEMYPRPVHDESRRNTGERRESAAARNWHSVRGAVVRYIHPAGVHHQPADQGGRGTRRSSGDGKCLDQRTCSHEWFAVERTPESL
ncbi:hypothetical protein GCM10027572_04420 [Flexivirga lutea]